MVRYNIEATDWKEVNDEVEQITKGNKLVFINNGDKKWSNTEFCKVKKTEYEEELK